MVRRGHNLDQVSLAVATGVVAGYLGVGVIGGLLVLAVYLLLSLFVGLYHLRDQVQREGVTISLGGRERATPFIGEYLVVLAFVWAVVFVVVHLL